MHTFNIVLIDFCSDRFKTSNDTADLTNIVYFINLHYNQTTSNHLWQGDTKHFDFYLDAWDNWDLHNQPRQPHQPSTKPCTVVDPANGWRWKSAECDNLENYICQTGIGELI